jgi:hypothetical protein
MEAAPIFNAFLAEWTAVAKVLAPDLDEIIHAQLAGRPPPRRLRT